MKDQHYHPQTIVEVFGHEIECDEEIADIIQLLNWNRCDTWLSCQDNMGKVWIYFSMEGAKRFVSLAHYNDRWCKEFEGTFVSWLHAQDWQWAWVEDGMVTEDESEFVCNGQVDEGISLRFPRKDLEKFRKVLYRIFRVKKKNKKSK